MNCGLTSRISILGHRGNHFEYGGRTATSRSLKETRSAAPLWILYASGSLSCDIFVGLSLVGRQPRYRKQIGLRCPKISMRADTVTISVADDDTAATNTQSAADAAPLRTLLVGVIAAIAA